MPILLKSAAGLFAGVMVGVLTFAFWPRLDPAVVGARPAVEQPRFVVAVAKAAEPAPTGADADKAAMEKLALALRAAPAQASGDTQPPTRSPAAASVNAGAANSTDRALRLRAEGLVALAGGDIAGARAFLERAADTGDARSLLVLGDTYDPSTLARMGAVGLKGDPARAHDFYARALSAGVAAARDRIASRELQQN